MELVKVKYLGSKKGGMHVSFPIGEKSPSAVKEVKVANPFLEMSREDAEKLVSFNKPDEAPAFAIVGEESAPEPVEVEKEMSLVDTQELPVGGGKKSKKKSK